MKLNLESANVVYTVEDAYFVLKRTQHTPSGIAVKLQWSQVLMGLPELLEILASFGERERNIEK